MKVSILTVQSKKEPWVEAAKELYLKKLKPFFPIEIDELKAARFSRERSEITVQKMDDALLGRLLPSDLVILFDERGRSLGTSMEFSKRMQNFLESGKSRIVFIVGGAFGVGPRIKMRANVLVTLSPLTMSHHVAIVVSLEQIYRAMTLIKGLPYHNEG